MLIKLDEAIAAVEERSGPVLGSYEKGINAGIRRAIAALRALPTVSVSEEMVNAAYDVWINYEGPKDWDTKTVLRLALEAALGATVSDGWEDIATANKDEMILGHADGMVRLVMWEGGRWVQVGATIEPGWFEPTEWKPLGPLPAPPSE